MTLAAFMDMGVDPQWLQSTIRESLHIDFELKVFHVRRMGVSATGVQVISKDSHERNYRDICHLIETSPLSDQVKAKSLRMFEVLADAEAKIHQCSKDNIHFHEVGAVDAIVDMVGAALCSDALGFEKIICSKLPLGRGMIQCAHGTLPSPAPATLEILKNVPVYGVDVDFEFVTPTGAAIIKTLAKAFGIIPEMDISKISYGAGSKELASRPNLLRIITGNASKDSGQVVMIETNIDNMNPEFYGYIIEKLLAQGALDVCMIPVMMKKNRPGTILQVMCGSALRDHLAAIILSETTTLGVRFYGVERRTLDRRIVEITTPFGPAPAKKIQGIDGNVRIAPEYEWCQHIAHRENIPLHKVYEMVAKLAEQSMD